ncbi:urate hydroxylase PuuD [Pyruvatibacter sp. HU-CL02332]|uniref:urate hydroxylase PuuD n=1 Tax=Pyruvatibacter sp. HU-CL02332 TaxID=3127650 RepID=UPI00310B326D
MAGILSNLRNTIIAGFLLALVLCIFYIYGQYSASEHFADALGSQAFWAFVLRWAHVLCGIMWIGLLYYFNFVQIPNMPNIPDEQKPAIGKVIAPAALWWFRWGAMGTIGFGIVLAALNGYLIEAYLLGFTDGGASTIIGIGMWLGTIMWFNVWFVIWPNQKVALGIVDAPAEDKPKAARTAMLFSRTNTLLSIPMLFAMVINQNAF